jgi:NAD(P)-dependent dehydrogenase (short-subunit alcohol dehydrogenase family)
MSPANTASRFSARGAVALVAGANRGISKVFARELIDRGAARVYGGARNPDMIDVPGVVPVRLDITDPAQVAAAADQLTDLTLLVNNVGICGTRPLLGTPSTQGAHDEMGTDFFGTLSMIRAFTPILGRNGDGAIINVLSILSFAQYAPWASYGASKGAAWALNNTARDELAPCGTHVTSVECAFVDSDITADIEFPTMAPEALVTMTLDALETGNPEMLADQLTRESTAMLSDYPCDRLPLRPRCLA